MHDASADSNPTSQSLRDRVADLEQAEEILQTVLEMTSHADGEAYFHRLVEELAARLGVCCVFVCEINPKDERRARTVAMWLNERIEEAIEYELAGTPCRGVIAGAMQCYPSNVQANFPDDHMLREMGIEGYLGIPLSDAAGNTIGHLGIMDKYPLSRTPLIQSVLKAIAARTATELQRLRERQSRIETERQLQQIVESLPIVLISVEAITNRILVISGAVKEVLGHEPETLLADSDLGTRMIHPSDGQRVFRSYRAGLESMKPFELQFRIVQPNCGKIVWLHQRVVPIAGPDGKLIRQDCVMYDITDRKRAELSLVDNEARLQKQNLALAALARSKTLHGDDLQAALREITKVAAETLDIERAGVWLFNDQHTGIECMDLYIRSENTHTQGAVIAARDYPRYFERLQEQRTIAADDASNDPGISELRESYLEPLGIASMVDAPIRIGERLIGVLCHEHTGPQRHWTQEELNFCGSIADLAALAVESSEHNQLQMKLQQSQKLQSIGTLAGGIAHDFNNLLAVILGNATLHMRDRSLPERARNALKEIVDAAERGSSLTSQLLAYARGGLHQPVPTDINKPIISVSEMLRRTVTGQTPIVLQLASDIPVTMADASQIEQVIMNLLMNAVQASDASGTVTIITDAVELNPEQARRMNMGAGGYVRIRVCDQGCGMNEQTQSRIFEPFFTTRATGRGMGLAATLGIIESHRGNIRVDSKPGEGTTMSVWLPATGEKPAAHAVPAERAEPFQPPTGDETILVIDDDSAVSRAVERLLASLGYVVVTHANVVEALAFLDLHSADINLVLADVHVSGAPEEEFFAQLCNRVGHAAFLLADVEDELAVLNLAGDRHRVAFIRKPYTLSTLSHQVRDLLDQVKTP